MKPLKFIECRGTPEEMGLQYGECARDEIKFCRELWQEYLRKFPVKSSFAGNAAEALKFFAPDSLTELRAIARGADVPEEFIFFLNVVDTFEFPCEHCTPLLLRRSPDGVIVAKNNDAGIGEEFPFVIRRCVPDKGIPFIQVTYAGWISGLDMMNSEGLANTHGSVGSKFPRYGRRIDIRIRLYELMKSCRTLGELLRGLHAPEFPLTGKGFSIAAADRSGECTFIDAAVPVIMERNRNSDFCWSTNLYETPGLENADARIPERKPFIRSRGEFIASKPVPENLEQLKAILSDHSLPNAPCHHGDPLSRDITVWAMYCLPEKGIVGVADGNPCCNEFKEFFLP